MRQCKGRQHAWTVCCGGSRRSSPQMTGGSGHAPQYTGMCAPRLHNYMMQHVNAQMLPPHTTVLAQRHPLPAESGHQGDSTLFQVLQAQHILERPMPFLTFLEQETATMIQAARSYLFQWTTAPWGTPIASQIHKWRARRTSPT